jgi:hypothetical protein
VTDTGESRADQHDVAARCHNRRVLARATVLLPTTVLNHLQDICISDHAFSTPQFAQGQAGCKSRNIPHFRVHELQRIQRLATCKRRNIARSNSVELQRAQRLTRSKGRHIAHLGIPEVQLVQRLTRCKCRNIAHLRVADLQIVQRLTRCKCS